MQSNPTPARKSQLPGFFGSVGKLIDLLSSVMGFAGGIILMLSSVVIGYEVVARYVFNSPTGWTFETSIMLVLVGVFLTISYGIKEDSHVNVQILVNAVPDKIRTVLQIITYLFVLGYAILFVRYGLEFVTKSFILAEKSSQVNMPLWPLKTAFLISFIMLALQTLKRLVDKAYLLLTEETTDRTWRRSAILTVLAFIVAFSLGIWVSMALSPVVGLILVLLVLLATGIPIGFSIAIVATFGMTHLMGWERGIGAVPQMTFLVWNDFAVAALPLFVFLGYIMFRSKLADDLYYFARVWVGHLPGGLAVATIAVCSIFAAISGSSVANALTVGLIAIPAMIAYKYDKKMAGGLVAVGGTLGVLIPPSTAMLLIGITTEESIGKLFMAGVVPGIVAFILISAAAVLICKKTGAYEPLPKSTFRERIKGTRVALGSLMMPVLMLGGIYSGVFTPTEAAGVGVIYALVFSMLTKRIKMKELFIVIADATKSVAMIGILVAGGMGLANVTAMLRVPQKAAEFVVSSGWMGWQVILGTMVLVFILGMFLDGGAITLLLMPILAPVVSALGYDVIWFAVLFVLATEIGMISPPVGLNVYVVQQVSGIDMVDIIKGSIPFILVLILVMLLVAFFPALALWLPNTM